MKPVARSVSNEAVLARKALRQRRVREELVAAGLELFRQRGYDRVTANEIADAVGLSRRSFFRYFRCKEDVAFDWMTEQGEFASPILAARPRRERPMQSMAFMFLKLAEKHDAEPELSRFRTHLIFDTPSLTGRYHVEHALWEGRWVEVFQRGRNLSPRAQFALRVQISTAITAFVVAIRSWAAADRERSLRPWVAAAFAALSAADAGHTPKD